MNNNDNNYHKYQYIKYFIGIVIVTSLFSCICDEKPYSVGLYKYHFNDTIQTVEFWRGGMNDVLLSSGRTIKFIIIEWPESMNSIEFSLKLKKGSIFIKNERTDIFYIKETKSGILYEGKFGITNLCGKKIIE